MIRVMFLTWLPLLLNLLIALLLAPLVMGLLRWSKARLQLRIGPSPLQPYRDLWKLWRRRPRPLAVPSAVFHIAPYAALVCYLLIALLTPAAFISQSAPLDAPAADLVLLAYIVGLAAFFIALGGMDSGSSFGHLGSSRAAFMHVLLEPGLILALAALGLYWHTTNLGSIVAQAQIMGISPFPSHPALLLIALSLAIFALGAAERLPFENPTTHLELTMAERAINVEYSGRELAAMETAEALRLLFLLTLLMNLFVPALVVPLSAPLPLLLLGPIAYLAKLGAALLILAVVELLQGQMRWRASVWPAAFACALALLSITVSLVAPRIA